MDRFDRGIEWFIDSDRYFSFEHDRIEQLGLVNFNRVPWLEMLRYLLDVERLNKDLWTEVFFIEMFGLKHTTFINVFLPRMAKYEEEYSFVDVLLPLEIKGLIVLHWECHDGTALKRKIWRRYSGVRYEECEYLHNCMYAKCMEHYIEDFRGTVHEFTPYV